jgi:hypothetical protein
MEYVIRTTVKHIRKSVDISIKKTLERIAEFDNDKTKSDEIFKTLAKLHTLKKDVEDFESNHGV